MDKLKKSPDIECMSNYYDLVSDILGGERQIKEKKTKYLPLFPSESTLSSEHYKYRLQLAKFTNIFRDTSEALSCKPFENKITIAKKEGDKNAEFLDEFVKDVDGAGNDLTTFSALTFFNAVNYGMDWIFVDYPSTEGTAMSIAKAKSMNLKPYWTHIMAKNVLAVETLFKGSKEIISYFKYLETTYGDEPKKVREYFLTAENKVAWQLWIENEDKTDNENEFILVGEGVLTIDEIPAIPFFTGRRDGRSFKQYPPMEDAANLQITLYQEESALEYTVWLAGYPTLASEGQPVIDPATNKPVEVRNGPSAVLYGTKVASGGTSKWYYVEPNANSMEFLKKNIDRTKTDLRELGRQPLTALSSQLTTVTTSIAAGKAKSAVKCWAYAFQDALQNALRLTFKWQGIADYEPEVVVFTGFDEVLANDKYIDALTDARVRGDISRETLLTVYKQTGILPATFDLATDTANLLKEINVGQNAPDVEDDVNPTDGDKLTKNGEENE